MMKKVLLMLMVVGLMGVCAQAANVTLTGVDAMGASSFNTAGLWSDGLAPSAGNDYFVGDGTRLRTPANGNSYTFAGDSLTINNTTAYGDGFMYKGTGSTGSLTIENLILDGGLISHGNGSADICNLYGNITVASASRLYPKQGPINIYSVIGGSAQITVMASDNVSANKIWIRSSANTFTGNIVNNGRLQLADDANLNFVIGASGVNNGISNGSLGTQQHSIFAGDFIFDLTGAGTTLGDSWAIISTVTASTYYDPTFNVLGFTDKGDDTWLKNVNGTYYEFSELTGTLTVVPEPASMLLLGLGGLVMSLRKK